MERPEPALQIRVLRREDYLEVLELARELAEWFRPLDQMALAIDLREHEGLVAHREGRLVGFLSYHLLPGDRAELSWFGIVPDLRGSGIGSRLLGMLEERLVEKGVDLLQLSTVPGDHDPTFAPTNAFYQRHGFRVKRRDEDYYAHGRPRLLFEKKLKRRKS